MNFVKSSLEKEEEAEYEQAVEKGTKREAEKALES